MEKMPPTMTPSPVETPRTATPEAAWPVRDTYHSFGNANSDVVVVLSQGGPLPVLVREVEILEVLSPLNLERVHLVNVHQAQTIDPAAFMAADITFDEAKAADVISAAMLATLVDHFQAQGKMVYVVGISFGAFMVQELLATQGNVAEGYLIANGRSTCRLRYGRCSPRPHSRFRGRRRDRGTVTGRNGPDVETVAVERNMARLASGLGHYRYSERLARVDMTNVVYVSGTFDLQVGRLSDAEIVFLVERGADVVQYDGGHAAPDAVALDAFNRIFPPDLLK